MNFLMDPLEGQLIFLCLDGQGPRGKHAYVDLTMVSLLVGLSDNVFVAG